MSGNRKGTLRKLISIVCAVSLMIGLFAVIDSTGPKASAASLPYIEKILATRTSYNILEIVPDTGAATIGYFVAGQEPCSSWADTLKSLQGAQARQNYADGLFGRLVSAGLMSGGTSSPMTYAYCSGGHYYTENYTPDSSGGWNSEALDHTESTTVTGTFSESGNGAYDANYAYSLLGGGGYIQDIQNFSYSANPSYGAGTYYYNPSFTQITAGTEMGSDWDGVAIYQKGGDGVYTYIGTVASIKASGGFNYSLGYYYVSDTHAPGSYSYAAVPNTSGDGFKATSSGNTYFTRTVNGYRYVGTGGTYSFSSNAGNNATVYYSTIYYKAGYTNNEWFKQYVFNMSQATYSNIDITVTVRKAGDVGAADISGADLIYLSSGSKAINTSAATAYTDDLSDANAARIYNFAAAQKPVITDYSIVSGLSSTQSANNIQKLVLLCLQGSFVTTNPPSLKGLTVISPTPDGVVSDTDKNFVNANIYCFNTGFNTGQHAVSGLVSQFFAEPFSAAVRNAGFTAIYNEIVNENFLRQVAGEEQLSTNVTMASAVRYIINYFGRRQTVQKAKINVLDIEPARVTSNTWLKPETVSGWIGNAITASNINVDHMTSAEFIGKIDSMNEKYDMVYLGMSTEGMNTSGGTPVYNDPNMAGLIYSNIGDTYKSDIRLAGLRDQDYVTYNGSSYINATSNTTANTFRFSGNDITEIKAAELEKFAEAGYPVILADGFISGGTVNVSKVDNSSYMYEAVSALLPYPNVMTQSNAASSANTSTVVKYLNMSKPAIALTSQPVAYTADSTHMTADADGYYYLRYVFTIGNLTDPTPASTTYDCGLYIDLNADGRYADNEKLTDIQITNTLDGSLVLPVPDGSGGEYYCLSADTAYQVQRQMPKEYVGIIPWKLEVVKNGADQIHASAQGYTRIAATTPQTINVLQIMSAGTTGSDLNLQNQLQTTSTANSKLLGNDGKYYTGIYGKLIADLADFKVSVTSIDTSALEGKGTTAQISSYINGFDMLIIGFADEYKEVGPNSAAAITSYIGSGKSVLFTHDTTSLSNLPSSSYPAVTDGTAPKPTKTLDDNDVVYNKSTNIYQSIDGDVNWYEASDSGQVPPQITGTSYPAVIFVKSSSFSDESDCYSKRAAAYIYQSGSYKSVSMPSNLTSFKSTYGSNILYVNCSDVDYSSYYEAYTYKSGRSKWYTETTYDIGATFNFYKYSASGTKYTCPDFYYTYYSDNTVPSSSNGPNTSFYVDTSDYNQLLATIVNGSTDTYSYAGAFDGTTYSINGSTYYPAAGAAFPTATLYSQDPSQPGYKTTTVNQVTALSSGSSIDYWGYYYNTVLRDAVGLDRYGVTSSLPLTAGGTASILKTVVRAAGSLSSQAVQGVLADSRGIAYTPNSGRASTVNEVQGYTNYSLIRFPQSNVSQYKYTNNAYSSMRETTTVSQVNKGQITTYPYDVNTANFNGTDSAITSSGASYMSIGTTHEQYYQINMNTNDIVAWYCLSSGGTAGGYYSDMPNDVTNAYYIYNKGNVTYSGVGHTAANSNYTGNVGQNFINEAKLFVNTMIAAYRSGMQAPSVNITESASGTADKSVMYLVADNQNSSPLGSADAESRAVYFKIIDPSLDENRTDSVSYYYSDPGGSSVSGISENVSPLTADTYNANGTAETSIKGGFVYKFFLPDSLVQRLASGQTSNIDVYVKVTSTDGNTTLSDTAMIAVRKIGLFDLK